MVNLQVFWCFNRKSTLVRRWYAFYPQGGVIPLPHQGRCRPHLKNVVTFFLSDPLRGQCLGLIASDSFVISNNLLIGKLKGKT